MRSQDDLVGMNLSASSLEYDVTHLGIFINCLDAIAECTFQCEGIVHGALVSLVYLQRLGARVDILSVHT